MLSWTVMLRSKRVSSASTVSQPSRSALNPRTSCSLSLPSGSILQRLGQMRRLNLLQPLQISSRPRQLEHAMKRPRAHVELLHRRAHERLARLAHFPVFANLRWAHVGVAGQRRAFEARLLTFARGQGALADHLARLAGPVGGEFLVLHTRHFHVDVKPIQQRAANSLLV